MGVDGAADLTIDRLVGRGIRRVEDDPLVTGRGRFVDDLPMAGCAHLAVVRSPLAHGRIQAIDAGGNGLRGVLLVWTAEDLPGLSWPQALPDLPPRLPLAAGKVRYVGEPIVAVVAGSRHSAADARDEVHVDLDPLEPVVDPGEAMAEGAPLLYEELGSNVVYRSGTGARPGMFDAADVVVSHSYVEPRIAPGMLESRGILVVPEGDRLVVYCSHQAPHRLRDDLSRCLSMDLDKVRVVTPEVGGAFGAKGTFYPEYLLAAHAARTLGRPVKYVETRSENLMVATHGRAQRQSVGLGARADGTLVGMRFRTIADFGAAADNQRWCLLLTEMMLSGCYRIPTIEAELLGVLTNTAPVGAFRGAGKPEATYAIERTMDHLARRLGIDPAELRRRNFIAPEEFPYDTGGRAVYDSGAYRTALDLALDRAGYAEVRRLQVERRGSGGPLIGVGIASYVEAAGRGEEYGNVTLNRDGSVTALTGVSPHGQGHETAWAQVVADQLTVRADRVVVVHGDTGQVPRGEGTGSSRSAAVGAGAVGVAARRVAERLRVLAAELLEAAPEDIRLAGGRAEVVGTDVGIDVSELAAAAGGVSEETVLSPPGPTFPFGCHVCRVEIDPDTGVVAVVGYVAVDDCGTVINPMLTEGQILGGVVQGISHALREEVRFDEAGNPLTANWATYLMPAAADVPPLMTGRTETPSPINPMGVKGVGEAGAIGSTPAVANAVFDALAPRGVSDEALPMPFTPTRVWTALRGVAP